MGNLLSQRTLVGPEWLAIVAASIFVVRFVVLRSRTQTTRLHGPPRASFMYGQRKLLQDAEDAAADIQEDWADKYGMVYTTPGPLGQQIVTITDPKAVAHVFTGMETTYNSLPSRLYDLDILLGKGNIITTHGDHHRKQRRAIAAGFTNAKLREYTATFFDSAYKVKAAWDAQLENEACIQINITPWMNAISLDSLGLAGFSYDFKALSGELPPLGAIFEAFMSHPLTLASTVALLLAPVVPLFGRIPTKRLFLRQQFGKLAGVAAREIIARASQGEHEVNKDDKSVISLLIKAQSAATGYPMTEEEVNSQMRTFMLAGYETTSVTMTWALIELSRHPKIQTQLREELCAAFPGSDPTWDDLGTGLPLLDGVVHETLRLHPSVVESLRVTTQDDVLPLSVPITLPDGQTTDHVVLSANTTVTIPIPAINRMRRLWGADAHEFKPERWLNGGEDIPALAKEIQGHRHLATFAHGPRTCIGKGFAVAEFKAVLATLIRNYEFELPDGPPTPIRKHVALISRPTVDGQLPCHVPLRIRRVEQD